MADEIVAKYRVDVDNASKSLTDLSNRVLFLESKLEKAGAKGSAAVNNIGSSVQGLGSKFANLGSTIAGAFGITAGIAGFVSIMRNAIGITTNFEAQMSKVKAVTGATAKEMYALNNSAKALGASTKFTATEVGQLQEEFGKLGFTTKEILAATDGTLALAAAAGTTLSDAASVAGSTIRGFGLDASEAGRVADVMALAFSKSALDIEDFRESMKLVAPIAAAANIDLETTTALLARLSDVGLKGSIAGTGLKNLLSKLSDTSSVLSQELGFTVKNSNDLFRAFKQLEGGNIDLTAATELTDERSKAAFLSLIKGIDTVQELKTALDGAAGSAKVMADIMQDNFKGAVDELSSAWEGLVLQLISTEEAEKAVRALSEMIRGQADAMAESNEQFVQGKLSLDEYKESLLGMSGLGILRSGEDIAEQYRNANIALADLRATQGKGVDAEYFRKQVEQQATVTQLLYDKLLIAREALKEFRDRQTDVGDNAPTVDAVNNLAIALDNVAGANGSAEVRINNIETLSNELKILKEQLEKSAIGGGTFWKILDKIEAKIKQLTQAQAMTKFAEALIPDEEPESQALMNKITAELDAENKMLDGKKEAHEEFNEWQKGELENWVQTQLDANKETTKATELTEEEKRQIWEAAANTTIQLIGMVSQSIQEGYQRDLQNLDERLNQGLISEQEYDKEKRELLSKQNDAAKQAAIFQAIINTALAVTSALTAGPIVGPILAALAGILGAAQIAFITSQQPPQFAKGVVDLQGEGTGTSDSISAKLSKGESVITAKETSKHKGLLEAMNKGLAEKYILSNYVKPALDSAMLSGFADMGKSAEVNGLTANLKDHNIIAAMDRHRAADVAGFKMLAAKLDRRQPKRGGYA
jgi:TP901 family phage tail tape measure protein